MNKSSAELTSIHKENVIARRLHTATHMKVDLEASMAWNERRIIRGRMEYYTSTQVKVKS